MPSSSRLARLEQVLVCCIVAAALGWTWLQWRHSPWLAAMGAIAILFSYALLIAVQCALLWSQRRGDPALRPTLVELVRAWWGEIGQVPRVFFWRQPFRWRAVPDELGPHTFGKRGVVFVHGFICNRGFWTPWMRRPPRSSRPSDSGSTSAASNGPTSSRRPAAGAPASSASS